MALEVQALRRHWGGEDIVRELSLSVATREAVAILGPSGCGKTTLLHMIGLLDRPNAGKVLLRGVDAWALSSAARARLRLELVGFVFQQNNLLGHCTARENVALPAWRRTKSRRAAERDADEWLERLGLSSRKHVAAAQLSTGEAQRVAIARALVNRPAVLLADEPTGNLDSRNANAVLEQLVSQCNAQTAVIIVTHDKQLASQVTRTLTMRDGRLEP